MNPHPIRLAVNDDLRRSRVTVLFRPLLGVPYLLWLWAWSFSTFFVAIVNWFATLITGRPRAGTHDFLARFTRYNTHVYAYLGLVANPFPRFLGEPGHYPVDVVLPEPELQRRWTTAIRIVLAVPAALLAYVFSMMTSLIALAGWVVALATGRMPKGMRDLSAYCLWYQAQALGYLLLLTARYPTLYAVPA